MQSAMQELVDYLFDNNFKINTDLLIKINESLNKEKKQIEAAWENGKNYPYSDCDGKKYYFMKYISND